MTKDIILLGFRYCGKTTIGKILSVKTNKAFVDIDEAIIKNYNESIDSMTNNGKDWKRFRAAENFALQESLVMRDVVISCGGGIGVNDIFDDISQKTFGQLNGMQIFSRENALRVVIDIDMLTLEDRIRSHYLENNNRPSLNGSINLEIDNIVSENINLYKSRKVAYCKLGDLIIDGTLDVNHNANYIMKYI